MSNINTYTPADKTDVYQYDYLHMGLRVKYEYVQIGTRWKCQDTRLYSECTVPGQRDTKD